MTIDKVNLNVFGSYQHHLESAYSWFQSGKYPNFFRCLPQPVNKQDFANFPQLVNQTILMVDNLSNSTSIGMVSIYGFDMTARNCNCGIIVQQEYQGKGTASLVCMKTLTYLFDTMNMRKVGIECLGSDEKVFNFVRKFWNLVEPESKGLPLEKCPWFDGKKRQDTYVSGKYEDVWSFSIFKHEFRKIMESYYGRKS